MTERYTQMLQEISDSISGFINQKEYDVRSLNSSICHTASKFDSFEDMEAVINTKLKDCAFVAILTGLVFDFLSGKRNYECSFKGAISFPAFALVRVNECRSRCDIKARWIEAGGKVFSRGKMIALKSDPIWKTISHFGFPFPPFNYCRCWEVEDVDYDTCVALRLVDDSYSWRSVTADAYNDPGNILTSLPILDFILQDMCESKEVTKLLKPRY